MSTTDEPLHFTPASLADLETPPVFTLRAPTSRDRRQHQRFLIIEGIRPHRSDEIRPEILNGLRQLWGADDYEKHAPVLEAYWAALDEFAAQRKANQALAVEIHPDFEYDREIETAIRDLIGEVQKNWRPLAVMLADNAEFAEMQPIVAVAVAVKSWAGLNVSRQLENGYLTIDCADMVQEALGKLEEENGLVAGTAWSELFVASLSRTFRLDIDLTAAPEPDALAEISSEEPASA